MTKRTHTPIILALLIAALLAGAYLIVAENGSAMSSSRGEEPSGLLH